MLKMSTKISLTQSLRHMRACSAHLPLQPPQHSLWIPSPQPQWTAFSFPLSCLFLVRAFTGYFPDKQCSSRAPSHISVWSSGFRLRFKVTSSGKLSLSLWLRQIFLHLKSLCTIPLYTLLCGNSHFFCISLFNARLPQKTESPTKPCQVLLTLASSLILDK